MQKSDSTYTDYDNEISELREENRMLREEIALLKNTFKNPSYKKLFSQLFNSLNDAALIFRSSDETVLLANQKAADLYGLKIEEFIGRSMLDFSRDNVTGKNNIDLTISRGSYTHFTSLQNTADGAPLLVQISAFYIEYYGNSAILSINRDISENKLLLDSIDEHKKEWELILDTINEMVAFLNPDFTIKWANRAYAKAVGLTTEEIAGKYCYQIWHNKDSVCEMCTPKDIFNGVQSSIQEKTISDGRCFVSKSYPFYNRKNIIAGAVEFMYDITERKENEIQLSNAIAAKDKFFSIIAHDLRAPFSTLLNITNALQNLYDTLDDAKILEFIGEVKNTSIEAQELLLNLLDWSRTQTGSIKPKMNKYSLAEIFDAAVQQNQGIAINKDIEIATSIDNSLKIFVDWNMLLTILRNLISNSVKFSQRFSVITLTGKRESDSIVITVSDQGMGMDEKMVANLFNPDKTISLKGTENEAGSGIGMHLCYEFVKANNGRIKVSSRLNAGTSTEIRFPVPEDV